MTGQNCGLTHWIDRNPVTEPTAIPLDAEPLQFEALNATKGINRRMTTEYWPMHPNPPRRQLARIVFDRGGAVTVQIGNHDLSYIGHAHRHTDPARAAQDILDWLSNRCYPEEGGDDPDAALLKPSSEDIRSGRYLVTEIDDDGPDVEAVARDLATTDWENAKQFVAALRGAK